MWPISEGREFQCSGAQCDSCFFYWYILFCAHYLSDFFIDFLFVWGGGGGAGVFVFLDTWKVLVYCDLGKLCGENFEVCFISETV